MVNQRLLVSANTRLHVCDITTSHQHTRSHTCPADTKKSVQGSNETNCAQNQQ